MFKCMSCCSLIHTVICSEGSGGTLINCLCTRSHKSCQNLQMFCIYQIFSLGMQKEYKTQLTTYTGTPSTSVSYFGLEQVIQFSLHEWGLDSSSSPLPHLLYLFRRSTPRNGLPCQSVGLKHILDVNHKEKQK